MGRSRSPPGSSSEVSSSPAGPGGGAVQCEWGGGDGGQGGRHRPHRQRVGRLLVAVARGRHHHWLGQGCSFGWNERENYPLPPSSGSYFHLAQIKSNPLFTLTWILVITNKGSNNQNP